MVRNRLQIIVCLALVIVMAFSLSTTAFAAGRDVLDSAGAVSSLQSNLLKSVLSHKNFISKEIVRSQFRTVAAAAATVGCTSAAYYLEHSLHNRPSDVSFGASSKYAVQIMKSSECRELAAAFAEKAAGKSQFTTSGSIALDSTTDLYLSYNLVSYTVSGDRNGNTWNLTITFYDRYDFSAMAWESTLSSKSVVTAINNYAVYAQTLEAIVPYDIAVTVNTTVAAQAS